MGVDTIGGIVHSGLDLQQKRLEVSASNVANVNTEGYEPQRVVAQERADGGVEAQVEGAGDAEVADAAGTEPTPGYTVDLVQEQVVQIESRAGFEANLRALEAADEMDRELLDVKA